MGQSRIVVYISDKLAAIGKIEAAFRFACHLHVTAYLKRLAGRFCWAAVSAHARWLDKTNCDVHVMCAATLRRHSAICMCVAPETAN